VSGSVNRRVPEDAAASADTTTFFGSIVAGMLLGLGADKLFDTDPVLVVAGIIAGSVIGFWRMWTIANRDDSR
jgi:F0F1-type ATP synthase assembly protein I